MTTNESDACPQAPALASCNASEGVPIARPFKQASLRAFPEDGEGLGAWVHDICPRW